MMRQAGRYHSHYQGLRTKHSFMELCRVPELAAQVALGPVDDFKFDVAILFSDILFPLDAMGLGLTFGDGGPQLSKRFEESMLASLKPVSDCVPALRFQHDAMKITREILPKDVSLIGFVGGLFTLFSYAVGGKHDGHLIPAKQNLHLFSRFCDYMVPLLAENISLQLAGGAECVMIFDTAAGELSPALYKHYVLPQLKKLFAKFPKKLGYYSKTTQATYLEDPVFRDGTLLGLGYDHRWDLAGDILPKTQNGFVQGNFDQALLHLDEAHFKVELDRYLEPFKELRLENRVGWVCGLGHGVLPKTPEKNVRHFVERVRSFF
jgi:uroporphyrinogen decarboxylase